MSRSPVRLKLLLQERYWQTYRTFQREYDKAAQSVDPALKGTWPSRAQLGRWVSGDLKGLPYPDHCRVLEKMFPGWAAEQLFELCSPDAGLDAAGSLREQAPNVDRVSLVQVIEDRLDQPQESDVDWEPAGPPLSNGERFTACCY